MTTAHHRQRRPPRASLAPLLAAAVACVALFGKLAAFFIPSRRALPGTSHPPTAVATLPGWFASAARGVAEAESSEDAAGSASAEEEDGDYEFSRCRRAEGPGGCRECQCRGGEFRRRCRRAEVIGELKPGQEFQGVVTRVLDFGAFVDIGHDKEGLVPRSKLQDGFTENTRDVVKEGQGVTVWVSQYDGVRLTLSMSRGKVFDLRTPQADLSLFEGVDSSERLSGTVVNVRDFGAFVAVAPPGGGEATAQGLVHITQLKDGFVERVADEVSVGDKVQVRVLSVDLARNKLALSMKSESAATGRSRGPDLSAFQDIPDTEWLPGTVKGLANFGAFVEVRPSSGGASAQGLLHISQIKEGFIEDPAEELEVDQEVKVRVLSVDAAGGKMSLSMREVAS